MLQQANELAQQFSTFPREQAVEAIRNHIEKFWEPPTRDQLISHVARGGAGLHELVIEAVKRMPANA